MLNPIRHIVHIVQHDLNQTQQLALVFHKMSKFIDELSEFIDELSAS